MSLNIPDLENCNRCCSDDAFFVDENTVQCNYCGFFETLEVWQLRGWRSIVKYPPTHPGTIFVYGKEIGRCAAKWDSAKGICDVDGATHWLRTPDPTKQINMQCFCGVTNCDSLYYFEI